MSRLRKQTNGRTPDFESISQDKQMLGSGRVAQQFRVLAAFALPKDLGFTPNTHMEVHNYLYL